MAAEGEQTNFLLVEAEEEGHCKLLKGEERKDLLHVAEEVDAVVQSFLVDVAA